MNIRRYKSVLNSNLSNIPGWRTKRRIVVIESDDWGSIRMSSPENYNALLRAGIPVDKNHYNRFDALESNEDLILLMDSLKKFTDSTGRTPVFTGVNIVANPDFQKIRENNFSKYEYELVTETFKKYPNHNKVPELWQKAINERLMVPTFHGREHLNVQRWMRALQSGNKATLLGFEHGVTGLPVVGIDGENVPAFQEAFDLDVFSDVADQKGILESGIEAFTQLYGFNPGYFVPANGFFSNALEKTLFSKGIKYINTAKKQQEPLGDHKYKMNLRYIGKQNEKGQIYITRNCFFEPASSGFASSASFDWVGRCLNEIETAFRWRKPAVISSHRVNYIGFLVEENRTKSLILLELLIKSILKKWPDVEFMTTVELGNLIASTK